MDGTSGTGMGLKPPKPGSFGIWGPPTTGAVATCLPGISHISWLRDIAELAETPPVVSDHALLNYTELVHALWQPPASIQGAQYHAFRLSVRRVASAVGPSSRGTWRNGF